MTAWWILVCILCFVALVLGLFLFPGVHQAIIGIDTSQGGYIENGLHTLTPYAFIGAIVIGLISMIKGRSGGGGNV
jgi:hypothetical protein